MRPALVGLIIPNPQLSVARLLESRRLFPSHILSFRLGISHDVRQVLPAAQRSLQIPVCLFPPMLHAGESHLCGRADVILRNPRLFNKTMEIPSVPPYNAT
jgi:hypothetical protein